MLLTLLAALSFQHNSHVHGEFMTVKAGFRIRSSSKTNRAHPSPGAELRGPSSHETIDHDVLALERYQRELGIRFQRCGDSVIFCHVSEVCTESGSPSIFICTHAEKPLADANSTIIPPANSTESSPTPSPAALEAPVAVSRYWDDPKANSPPVVVSSRAASHWGDGLVKAGSEGMVNSYDSDGDGVGKFTPLFCFFGVLFLLGLYCVYRKKQGDDS